MNYKIYYSLSVASVCVPAADNRQKEERIHNINIIVKPKFYNVAHLKSYFFEYTTSLFKVTILKEFLPDKEPAHELYRSSCNRDESFYMTISE